jgi:glycosyltransferase involved in cell wall biosynthesis
VQVAVDVRRMQDRPLQGVGRYLANMLPLVAADVSLVLLGDARRPAPDVAGLEGQQYVPLRVPPRLPEVFWLQGSAGWWLRRWEHLFHGTFNSAPWLAHDPVVVSIYDLSFEHHPEDLGTAKRRLFQLQCRTAARRARRVLVPTQAVKADVAATYGIAPDRIIVSPCAVDPIFHPRPNAEIDETLGRLALTQPYVVALGGARRRGLPVAVEAWRASGAAARGVGLAVVGPEAPAPGAGIRHLGRLSDEDWPRVLAGAAAFCYPTRFEGFGMPGLEAAASGTPVVCARLEVLEEILGPAAEWCDEPTAGAMARGLSCVLDDPAREAELRRVGPEWAAAAPGWPEAAAAVVRAYQEAAD